MKIMFCIPGRQYSDKFLNSWTNLIAFCNKNGIEYELKQGYSSMVHQARTLCLEGVAIYGNAQPPFLGKKYDYIMWIDSDIVFKPEDLTKLITAEKDIVSGIYKIQNSTVYATRLKCLPENFRIPNIGYIEEINETYGYLTEEQTKSLNNTVTEADYTGMGWMLIKHGVMENIEYPWFHSTKRTYYVENTPITDFISEDAQFCFDCKSLGYKIWIDPTVIVGHEKTLVI